MRGLLVSLLAYLALTAFGVDLNTLEIVLIAIVGGIIDLRLKNGR